MPSIAQSLMTEEQAGRLSYVPLAHPTMESLEPSTRSPFHRCPVPPIGAISVDNVEQWRQPGLPQFRVFIKNG